MHSKLTPALFLFLAAAWPAVADENFATLTVGSQTYTNVTVTVVTASAIYFTYDGGMGDARIKNLSPDLQKHFHYNETAAAAIEQKQAQATKAYRVQIIHQGAARPADESIEAAAPASPQSSVEWLTDLPAALNRARSEGKLVLLDFTGSDWCPWCIKLDHDILSAPDFTAYAQNKLVLVKVDFPRHTPLSENLKDANEKLGRRYNVDGYPTCILVDASGNELGRQVGYREGGVSAFLTELDGFSKK
jgi:thioredoxin-related protein